MPPSWTIPSPPLLPAPASGLTRGGKQVTLGELAAHTSGLPRMPGNFAPANGADPYADYDTARMLAFLGGSPLQRTPGESYEYSNLGGGTLGYALTRNSGGFEATVRTRILAPLGMTDTGVVLTPAQSLRLAVGHGRSLEPVANWNLNESIVGAGGLRSTANDMARYLRAAGGWEPTPLAAAFKLAEAPSPTLPRPASR